MKPHLRIKQVALASGLLLGAGPSAAQDVNTLGLPLPRGFGTVLTLPDIGNNLKALQIDPKAGGLTLDQTPNVVIGPNQLGFFNPNSVPLTFAVTVGGTERSLTLAPLQISTIDCSPCDNAAATIGTGDSFATTVLAVGGLYLLKDVGGKWNVVNASPAAGQAN
jgi:hypothetical protein